MDSFNNSKYNLYGNPTNLGHTAVIKDASGNIITEYKDFAIIGIESINNPNKEKSCMLCLTTSTIEALVFIMGLQDCVFKLCVEALSSIEAGLQATNEMDSQAGTN